MAPPIRSVRAHGSVLPVPPHVQLDKAKAGHTKGLARLVEKGKIQQADADAALKRICYVTDMAEAKSADWAVEAASENPQLNAKLTTRRRRSPRTALHPAPQARAACVRPAECAARHARPRKPEACPHEAGRTAGGIARERSPQRR